MKSLIRRPATWAAILGLVLVVSGAVLLVPRLSGPDLTGTAQEEVISVDSPTRTALMEAADHFLETDPGLNEYNDLATSKPALHPRVFCHEDLVEVRRKDPRLLVGVVSSCEELAPSGNKLVTGTGYADIPQLLTMESVNGRFTVQHVEEAGDDQNEPTERTMFSPAGAPRAIELESFGDWKGIYAEARLTFGLPPNAKVVNS